MRRWPAWGLALGAISIGARPSKLVSWLGCTCGATGDASAPDLSRGCSSEPRAGQPRRATKGSTRTDQRRRRQCGAVGIRGRRAPASDRAERGAKPLGGACAPGPAIRRRGSGDCRDAVRPEGANERGGSTWRHAARQFRKPRSAVFARAASQTLVCRRIAPWANHERSGSQLTWRFSTHRSEHGPACLGVNPAAHVPGRRQ